jgi:polyisoprenoid-binding protein YceI
MGKIEIFRKKNLSCAGLLITVILLQAVAAAPQYTPVASQSTKDAPRSAEQQPASTNRLLLAIDPVQSGVHWTLDTSLHTVHGTFALKRGSMRLDPATGQASGEVVADAASGKSGNDSRDKKMHQDVLESAQYSDVIFRPDRVEGKIPAEGSWTVNIHGVFVLHGTQHELTVPAEGEIFADHWKGKAKFSIPFIQWGLKNPGNFLLKVNPAVDVELDLTGSLRGPATK